MSRRMPKPQNDPKERGKRRSSNIDVDENLMKSVLEKLKKEDSSDDETNWVNIRRILRAIPRNDPNNPFKPHSEIAIRALADLDKRGQHPLLPPEEQMLQYFGYDLDRCTIYDQPNPSIPRPNISKEDQFVINQLPAWLRCFIETRYKKISAKYGKKTPLFFKSLVKYMELLKAKHASLAGEPSGETEDSTAFMDFEDDYNFLGEEDILLEQELRRQNAGLQLDLDPFRLADVSEAKKKKAKEAEEKKRKSETEKSDEEIKEKSIQEIWSPILLQKAGDALRASLIAGASDTEEEEYYDEVADEIVYRKERKKGVVRLKDEEFVYRGAHWETIVAEESHFKEEAEEVMNEEFMGPEAFKEYIRTKRLERNEERKVEKKTKKGMKKVFQRASVSGRHPLFKESGENQKNAAIWRERGVGRRPSSLFIKSVCDGPIVEVERRLHQSRRMEAMRAYANWIVASLAFKYFIMIIIIGNAALLALEIGEIRNQQAFVFETLDSFFLSVYFAEFFLKFFAYPNQFFRSGFNVFDFLILIVSLIKSLADWLNWGGNLEFLRYLTIIRALRILRGVSLSVHIQVLVRALIDTLRNHVVSVVLLLVLLMYITSIIAFYLYGNVSGLDNLFGSFLTGMLQLFTFVTMDGWTEILDSFNKVGKMHQGRIFCLILIVLGNFLFSNIFIAIIIMQISDATDYFRKTRANEKDLKVSRIQDEVFRRQKLDMRQLLARQKLGVADDFYELGSKFVRKLRHDDLVDTPEIIFSPLWIDALYKSMQRMHHTSTIIMNLHRKMADRLVRLGDLYDEDRLNVKGISRARYNRYANVKAKLRLLKEQFLKLRKVKPKSKLRVNINDNVDPRKKEGSKTKGLASKGTSPTPSKITITKEKEHKGKGDQGKEEVLEDSTAPKIDEDAVKRSKAKKARGDAVSQKNDVPTPHKSNALIQKSTVPPSQKMDAPTSEKGDVPSSQREDVPTSQKAAAPSSQKENAPSSQKSGLASSQQSTIPSSLKNNAPSSQKGDVQTSQKSEIQTSKGKDISKKGPTQASVKSDVLAKSEDVPQGSENAPVSEPSTATEFHWIKKKDKKKKPKKEKKMIKKKVKVRKT